MEKNRDYYLIKCFKERKNAQNELMVWNAHRKFTTSI